MSMQAPYKDIMTSSGIVDGTFVDGSRLNRSALACFIKAQ